ncbi:hypothetical protein B0E41_23445 [Hydrogenophaga sp. A37]|nr:hypothetical protein B0E41_23445 [Hydrogenophaga sp. A37]
MPWRKLIALIAAGSPVPSTGRPPFAHETTLRIHFLQQWFGLSDLAMEHCSRRCYTATSRDFREPSAFRSREHPAHSAPA